MDIGRVFLPQEPPPHVDISQAAKFGYLQDPMMARSYQAVATARPAIQRMGFLLQSFTDEDYILSIGDPVLIGIAQVLAARYNGGRYKLLKWDRKQSLYYIVQVDIEGDLP